MDILLGLGISLPIVTSNGISVVTGVSQGVRQQQRANAEEKERMRKFHIDVSTEDGSLEGIVTLRDGRLWIESQTSHVHPFTGFFLPYPSPSPPHPLGMVSTISADPPLLNWIYIDRETNQVMYGNRTASIQHIVNFGYNDEGNVLGGDEAWEGFVIVEDEMGKGKWSLFFDISDDRLRHLPNRGKRRTKEVFLKRRMLEDIPETIGVKTVGNIGVSG
ncbi:hypothetical protein K470DRAFT_222014 [Piedraia hortae CBS 480.64]|uniref:Uncharacterized protein n=1 Tax=Piedraia hortae CBS 480.64 TaxID=1314780 RepID=A0A6A7BSJ8_9PEZI|nr:hypothetical protein K470DRAFT_222014 [Piedraia hortae CBS 480.64]